MTLILKIKSGLPLIQRVSLQRGVVCIKNIYTNIGACDDLVMMLLSSAPSNVFLWLRCTRPRAPRPDLHVNTFCKLKLLNVRLQISFYPSNRGAEAEAALHSSRSKHISLVTLGVTEAKRRVWKWSAEKDSRTSFTNTPPPPRTRGSSPAENLVREETWAVQLRTCDTGARLIPHFISHCVTSGDWERNWDPRNTSLSRSRTRGLDPVRCSPMK